VDQITDTFFMNTKPVDAASEGCSRYKTREGQGSRNSLFDLGIMLKIKNKNDILILTTES
jgi:hypothetical protein